MSDQDTVTEVTDAVRGIWAEVLGTPIHDHSDFFVQGGSSPAALAICSGIEASFRVRPPLRTLFEHPRFDDYVRAISELVGQVR